MTSHHIVDPNSSEPSRLPARRLPKLLDIAIPLLAALSAIMLFLALPNIIGGSDVWSFVKAAVLSFAGALVAYGINKLAIERGAPLATKGYFGAGFVSVVSILAVGGGLFAATYSGLVFADVAELDLQQHGADQATFVGATLDAVSKAEAANPAMRSIRDDLQAKAQCEIVSSCVSGRGPGGRGPVARVLEERAGRAASIVAQIEAGETQRAMLADDLNAALGEYRTVLGDENRGIWARRTELQAIDAKIGQRAAELRQSVPLALLTAYADELSIGAAIPGNREAEAAVNGILARHGASLKAVIAGIEQVSVAQPVFPKRTGVSETFRYIAHFIPVAAICAVVELIFPIVLWAYTVWALRWDIYRADQIRAVPLTSAPSRSKDQKERPRDPGRRDRPHRHRGNGLYVEPQPGDRRNAQRAASNQEEHG